MTTEFYERAKGIHAGQRFYHLVAVAPAGYSSHARRKPQWLFMCDCEKLVVVLSESAKSGNTKSCGCHRREATGQTGRNNRQHGRSEERLYRIWGAIHRRCEQPQNSRFDYYGGRGVSVCDEWKSVEAFRRWALSNGYADNLTLDRYPDNEGNYEPGNCRWATWSQQAFNRRPGRWPVKSPPADSGPGV